MGRYITMADRVNRCMKVLGLSTDQKLKLLNETTLCPTATYQKTMKYDTLLGRLNDVLGSGAVGTVSKVKLKNTEIAVKTSKMNEEDLWTINPLRYKLVIDAKTCIKFTDFLTAQIIPHVFYNFASYRFKNSFINLLELGTGKTLFDYIENSWNGELNIIMAIFFQICFTLLVIQDKYPHFTHNDLHTSNIFIEMYEPTKNGYFLYKFGDQFWKIPDYGLCVRILDFDAASFDKIRTVDITPVKHGLLRQTSTTVDDVIKITLEIQEQLSDQHKNFKIFDEVLDYFEIDADYGIEDYNYVKKFNDNYVLMDFVDYIFEMWRYYPNSSRSYFTDTILDTIGIDDVRR